MCKLFDEWEDKIRSFCDNNGLSFQAVKSMSQAWNNTMVALYYVDKTENANGLLEDTPSPLVLLIIRESDGNLRFEKTEYTEKYLAKTA